MDAEDSIFDCYNEFKLLIAEGDFKTAAGDIIHLLYNITHNPVLLQESCIPIVEAALLAIPDAQSYTFSRFSAVLHTLLEIVDTESPFGHPPL